MLRREDDFCSSQMNRSNILSAVMQIKNIIHRDFIGGFYFTHQRTGYPLDDVDRPCATHQGLHAESR